MDGIKDLHFSIIEQYLHKIYKLLLILKVCDVALNYQHLKKGGLYKGIRKGGNLH